jgi:nucleotidyltransferase/DNA polymerase involved in DNA repair
MRAACVFIPHFPIAVELLDRPELRPDGRDRPLVIGTDSQRKTVLDCSPEVEAEKVRRGMLLRQALALCPKATFLDSNPARYQEAFEAVLHALESISPLVEPAELGRAYVGVEGLDGLHRDEMALGEALVQACLLDRQAVRLAHKEARPVGSFLPSVGLGEGKFVAWAAAVTSAPGEVCAVPPGREAAFLAPLDVSLLPCSPHTLRRLELLGLRTIGDLANLPLGAVQAQFGPEGRRLWELAHGLDREPLRPRRHEESVSERLTFSEPAASTEALLAGGRQILGRLFHRPALRCRAVRQMRLRAALSDGRSWERTMTFREATADRDQMLYVLRCTLEAALPSRPVEEMEVTLSGLTGETGKQEGLFAAKGRRRAQLEEALRQLKARFGQSPVYHVVEVEPWSRIPERRLALIDYDP